MKRFMPGILLAPFLLVLFTDDSSQKTCSSTESPRNIRVSIPRETTDERMPAETRTEKPSHFVYTKTTCNVRSGPGIQYPIIRMATKAEKLECVALEGNWYRLKVAMGRPQQWIHKSVVRQRKKSEP